MQDFIPFPKIENIVKLKMSVTQKIHGSNAQIYITRHIDDDFGAHWEIKAGSRTRWLTCDDDNYGFGKWVHDNQIELINVLGEGRHYGEWCGKGINAGEGLSTKVFVLFDWWKYSDKEKYPYHPFISDTLRLRVVPVLYTGDFSYEIIDELMRDLKITGSRLTPPGWYMKPEGIVIDINGVKYKKVFDNEEIAWKRPIITREEKIEVINVDHLIQPKRLEKLLSRDEKYKREYPESLPSLVKDYIYDLIIEGQLIGESDQIDLMRKALSRKMFNYIKSIME